MDGWDLTEEMVRGEEFSENGWVLLTFQDGTKVGSPPTSPGKDGGALRPEPGNHDDASEQTRRGV